MTILFRCFAALLCLPIVCLHYQLAAAERRPPEKVRVGAYDSPPNIYLNESGDVAGIFPAVLQVIAKKEGWQLDYVHGTWEQCLKRLKNGDIDIMVDVAYAKERENLFSFSAENILLNWGTIYTKKGFPAESFLDLKGKIVAIVREDIHTIDENGIMRLGEKFKLDLKYLPVDSYREVFEMIHGGQADAGVVNRLFGAVIEDQFEIDRSPIVFNPVKQKFAFNGSEKADLYARTIDRYINRFKRTPDSIFHRIINSYLVGIEYDPSHDYDIKPFELSETELAWLKDHQTIRLGVDSAYAPYSYMDKEGNYQGLAIDLFDLIARQLGLHIEIVKGLSWKEILDSAEKGDLDVILTAVETPERKDYLGFTRIYLETPLVIMTKKENQRIEGPEDLSGTKIALVSGYSSSQLVHQEYPDIAPLMVQTPLEALSAVSTGDAEVYIGVLGVNDYLVRKHGISNLTIRARYNMLQTGQRVGVRKDWPQLVNILNKALNSISEKKRIELDQAWISSDAVFEGPAALQHENVLSQEETAWVKAHRDIRLGIDPEFAPFEFFDKRGKYAGIASEYIHILNKRLGLRMQVTENLTWAKAIEKFKSRKIDVLPCIGISEKRKGVINFSRPYMNYSRIIITRSDTQFVNSINDIKKMKIAVQKGSSHEDYLAEHSGIDPVLYPTLTQTLKAVSIGDADALVGNLASSIYWIRKENLTNLKIAGPVTYSSEYLHFGVRKDWPLLVSILDKGLASISPAKEKQIREKWIDVEFNPGLNPRKMLRYVAQGMAIFILALLSILVWNYRLKKEIKQRRVLEKALQEHQGELEQRIALRTADLSAANVKLLKEIKERKLMEKEQKRLQQQLSQARRMESLGTLAGGIAHDFNNILSGIFGYAQLAQTHLATPEKANRHIGQIIAGAQRAADLTRQILMFSRQTGYQKKPFEIYLEVNETLKLLRPSIPTTIEIKKRLDSRKRVMADPTKIHQLIMNLCTNAYHAMKEKGGTLFVSLTEAAFSTPQYMGSKKMPPGQYLKLEVSDTGHGMDANTLKRAFDPYFTTKTIGHGTGLGLALVQAIVEEHDAFLDVCSTPGQGTSFFIYFPIIQTPPQREDKDIKKPEKLHGDESIMVVDDEDALRDIYKNNLENFGYNVSLFKNGREALDAFKADTNRFDLIITDMTMPKLTGDKLSKEILKIKPGMPIILCSGFNDSLSKTDAIELGIRKFVQKPVPNQKMAALIREILDSGKKDPNSH